MNCSLCLRQIRKLSQAALERLRPISSQNLIWKTSETDPRKHTTDHEGLFYDLPSDEKECNLLFGGISPYESDKTDYYKLLSIEKFPLMVRKPALEAMKYIESIEDKTLPNVRILFYGDMGTGKTHTLVHLQHYLHLKRTHIVLNIRDIKRFTRSPYGIEESTSRPGRIDTPLNSAILLQRFKTMNTPLLENYNDTLVCSTDYRWSVREVTKAGEPLIKVADHGINRINHASDCVAVLIKELMLAADDGKIKLASFIDNVRFLFTFEAGILRHKDKKKVYIDEITVARALKKLVKSSHRNGLVVASCDNKFVKTQNQKPRDVLGEEGWEHFDPFIPIKQPVFDRKEFESFMNHYQDIGWFCRPESHTIDARDEIRFISGMNPLEITKVCRAI